MVVFWPVATLPPPPLPGPSVAPFNLARSKRGVNRPTERRVLKVFLLKFRIQSKLLTDLEILQLQWITDSSIFFFFLGGWGVGFWTSHFIKYFCRDFGLGTKFWRRIWVINHNGSADFHSPIHPLPSSTVFRSIQGLEATISAVG